LDLFLKGRLVKRQSGLVALPFKINEHLNYF